MDSSPRTRIVLAPHGLPSSPRARETCCRLLLACGADLGRVIEGEPLDPEELAERLPRVRALSGDYAPIVVLTRTTSLVIAVLRVRRMLQETMPMLAHAPWLIFSDQASEFRLVETADALGGLDGGLEHAPFWYAPDGNTYLVLSGRVRDARFVRVRLGLLMAPFPGRADPDAAPDSGVRETGAPPRARLDHK